MKLMTFRRKAEQVTSQELVRGFSRTKLMTRLDSGSKTTHDFHSKSEVTPHPVTSNEFPAPYGGTGKLMTRPVPGGELNCDPCRRTRRNA